MLSEGLKQLSELIRESSEVVVQDFDERQKIVSQGGKYQIFANEPSPRNHEILSLSDFVEVAKRYGEKGVIFHSDDGVVLIMDDLPESDRKDRIECKLTKHPRFESLCSLSAKPALNQRSLIRLLKHTLYPGVDESVLAAVRKVNFTRGDKSGSAVAPGKESMGRSIKRALDNAERLAEMEYINCQTPVYAEQGFQAVVSITLTLDIDLQNETFRLEPVPGSLESGIIEVQNGIKTRLKETGLPVFHGSP